MTEPVGRVFRCPVYRRFSDLDPLGHVNNVAYYEFLQEARVQVFEELGWTPTQDFFHVVVRQGISFRRPLGMSTEPIVVETSFTRIGGSSYTIAYRIVDEAGELAAEGETVMAVVDISSGKPVRIPEKLRSVLRDVRIVE